MSKITSNGNVAVVWLPVDDLDDPQAPTASELNGGLNLSSSIAWDNFTLGATDSDDWDDRALTDLASAVTRGFANYEADLEFFRDANQADTNSPYNDAFDAFRTPFQEGYLALRTTIPEGTPFAAGQRVSVFKFISGVLSTVVGGTSIKGGVKYSQQGILYVSTFVADSTNPLIALPATDSIATGEYTVIKVTLNGVDITHSCDFSSANTNLVAVSNLGIASWVSAGGPTTINVSHPAVTTGDTVAIATT